MFTRRQIIAATTMLALGAGGGVFFTAGIVRDQHRQLDELGDRKKKLTAELRQVLRENEESAKTLAAARAELKAGTSPTQSPPPSSDPIAAEVEDWFDRLQSLKRMFAEHPELAIPELAQLTDIEWFLAAKSAQIETGEQIRTSLAAVRTVAKAKFAQQMASAMKKHLAASNGQLPPNPQALFAYFIRPIPPSFFERYESLYTGNVRDVPKNGGNELVIQEKAPIDEDYDSRVGVNVDGMRSYAGTGPRAWVDAPGGYDAMIRRAQSDFARSNNGAKAAGLEQLAPFITPPLSPAKLEKLLKLERQNAR